MVLRKMLLVLILLIGNVRGKCPDAWVSYGESCYWFAHDYNNFADAENYCLQHDAYLVHINTNEENLFVKSFCRELKTHNYWIGLTDIETEGTWKWQGTNETTTFKDFFPGEPCCGRAENCAVLWSSFDFKWGDYSCVGLCMPICEKKFSSSVEVIG